MEIFRDLKSSMPEYEFVVCQDSQLSKTQYHALLASAKIVFSANLQETLGISMYEGILVNAIPLVPARLSYAEMFDSKFTYISEWTESWTSYLENKDKLIALIRDLMKNYDHHVSTLPSQAQKLTDNFFSASNLLKNIQ